MENKVGIVMISYNASTVVRTTLAGLRQSKNNTPYELLLIDNGSRSDEKELIYKAFQKHTSQENLPWTFLSTGKNLGFAGGNNKGIRRFLKDSSITHLCLLNSDVIVTDYWIDRLVAKNVEIVSAVTNKADSEQCVPTDYQLEVSNCFDTATERVPTASFDVINAFAQNWNKAWKDNTVICDVTFFCVMLTRELIGKVGLLDEKFFPGGYEDDDYCERVKKMGIPIYLARDVFMHHFGSSSFGQLQAKYFNEKASKNKRYAEIKHNITIRRRHERPIVGYIQDMTFALRGGGNRQLQQDYNCLYVETLTKLINHAQNEFSGIHGFIETCAHPVPEDLKNLTKAAVATGNIIDEWESTLQQINAGLNSDVSIGIVDDLERRMRSLAEAVYIKVECNFAMVGFLQAVGIFGTGHPPETKNYWKKAKWLFKKGLPFFTNFKGIVFFGGYPYKEREKDGYFQRIRSIDNLFIDRWRVYVDHMKVPGKDVWYDRPEPKVLVLHVPNHKHHWFMKLVVALCVLRCRTIYYHSVLRMNDSNFGRFMNWRGIKKLIDIHGVVPEEFRYHNDFFSAGIYDAHERMAVRKADYVITVTHSMHGYLQQKYRDGLKAKVIVLPIFPNFNILQKDKSYVDGKPVVVYAGGTHKWQQVPKMITAMNLTHNICKHEFYCPNPSEVLGMMPEGLRHDEHILVDSKPFSELLVAYEKCHFGYILREDIVVNHVACPTKLIEYIAMGIVPIVECENLGDFKSLGMQFLNFQDFIDGRLPDETERNEMARINFDIYSHLQHINYEGRSFLQNSLRLGEASAIKKAIKKPLAIAFPKGTERGIRIRKWLGRPEDTYAPVSFQKEIQGSKVPVTVETDSVDEGVLPDLDSCDVLVQVGNFLVGGLENVVLDLNQTLMDSGLRVSILVLGEAGKAAQQARERGMAVCITPYEERTYKAMLKKASPKVVIAHYSIEGTAICGQLNIPVIQIIHNTYMWFTPDEAKTFAATAKYTKAFIAVSDYVMDYSLNRLGLPAEQCLAIPNGIDISRFRDIDYEFERSAHRKLHGFTDEHFVFLNVGSITHQKNHISSVRAFHTVLKYCPNARLVILGKLYESGLWQEVLNYIAENNLEEYIVYVGESTNSPAYYAMADAFVHSAFFEGGQLSLLEAVVANLPVVTTEIGFAKHFKGRPGISMVPPPVEIIDYKGFIWQLTPTAECERNLAIEMLKVYAERTCPDLDEELVSRLDKHHAYRIYVDLIWNFIRTGEISLDIPAASWPNFIEEGKKIRLLEVSL